MTRITIVTFGSRGDIQPFCVVAARLASRGHAVSFVTMAEHGDLVRSYGLEVAEVGRPLAPLLKRPDVGRMFRGYFRPGLASLFGANGLRRMAESYAAEIALATWSQVSSTDLIVYNPFAFFAADIAESLGVPSLSVTFQPLLPSWRMPLALLRTRGLGRVGNRLSYEVMRAFSLVLTGRLRRAVRSAGYATRLGPFSNPLSYGLHVSGHVLASSAVVTPDPGDWPVPCAVTGYWRDEPVPGDALPDAVAAFLASGDPPIYIGFGSMVWNAPATTRLVLGALQLWGGRALLDVGHGAIRPPPDLPANILPIRGVRHRLLFPHVGAAIHHGGAGTTSEALASGIPSIVLPVLGDQLFWGRRIAALGAGPDPVARSTIRPETLARMIADVLADKRYRDAAQRAAADMAQEPGVGGAVEIIEAMLCRASSQPG